MDKKTTLKKVILNIILLGTAATLWGNDWINYTKSKGQSVPKTGDKPITQVESVAQEKPALEKMTAEQKKQALEQAIRDGRPREEIVKYMNFPAGMPVTKEGTFDKEQAKEQAKVLWQKKGKIIQEFANDVKNGMTTEEAYVKFAKKLANGDKDKEQQILAMYEGAKKAQEKLNGYMETSAAGALALAMVVCACLGYVGLRVVWDLCDDEFVKALIIGLLVATIAAANQGAANRYNRPNVFVRAQEAIYKAYVDQTIQEKAKPYETVSLKQARELIKIAQERQRD